MEASSPPPLPHIVIFPFMSKGHTIPLLHLAHLIRRRRLAVLTFITTPLNSPFLRRSLPSDGAHIVELPFPDAAPHLPAGVESTDQLPSISLFLPFAAATKLLKPHFEEALRSIPSACFLISDGFFSWTTESANKLGIPRIVFNGMGNFSTTVSAIVSKNRPHAGVAPCDEPFPVPHFPNLQLTRADLNPPFDDPDPKGPLQEFTVESAKASMGCYGLIVNSFYELDAAYYDGWNKLIGLKAWNVGPLCLFKPGPDSRTQITNWLDSRLVLRRPVLYVAFGSQADVSAQQILEIAAGLEKSGLDFLWVVRTKGSELGRGFDERVSERGRVVREWVDQFEILRHESVKGFVSHCGWNSVMESMCAGVPMLAWPMMAEQHLNAKFVVEELGIGVRVRASDGSKFGLVEGKDVERLVKELLVGERGQMAAERVKGLKVAAEIAVADGGSSAVALEELIAELSEKKRASAHNGR